jgi:hypothetical protein
MDDSEIIDRLGGTAEVARLCEVQPPSVSEWRRHGIPRARRQYLELLRPEIFRATGQSAAAAGKDNCPEPPRLSAAGR